MLWSVRHPRAFLPLVAGLGLTLHAPVGFAHHRGPAAESLPALVKRTRPAVVTVIMRFGSRGGSGAGVIISSDGDILTANHMVTPTADAGPVADEIRVRLADGRELPAHVIGRDPESDLALIHVAVRGLPAAPLGDSNRLDVGESVVYIGAPLGYEWSVTAGIVSAKGRSIRRPRLQYGLRELIQTDAASNHGNSGGPLVNMRGEVVGIASLGEAHGAQNVNFAVAIDAAKRMISDLRLYGEVRHGWLGLHAQGTARGEEGVVVTEVVPDSPAELAGLEPGDVVLRFDETWVTDADSLRGLIATAGVGQRVILRIRRDGRETELRLATTRRR
jgi:S1-C subfamily serine protease